MHPNDHVCLCFHVSLGKIRRYLHREDPPVASLISECLDAGTGCGWCVPFLKHLHAEHKAGRLPDLKVTPADYGTARKDFHKTGERDAAALPVDGADYPLNSSSGGGSEPESPGEAERSG